MRRFKEVFRQIPARAATNGGIANEHTVYHQFKLQDTNKLMAKRQYFCPQKDQEAWKTLLQQHLDAGRICPSLSHYISPAFIIPKSEPRELPRWINDYWEINSDTIPDNHPHPCIDNIPADCAKAHIWAKIDMTNSFFQTRVHLDNMHLWL
jgi:hypothetical protein